MSGWVWAVIVAVVIIVVLLIAYAAWQKRQRSSLQTKFGPEYDRAVTESDSRRQAEKDLLERQKRHEALNLTELEPATRERHMESWRQTQSRFVDAPAEAVRDADRLVGQVMTDRGYPMDNFEQRAADISVDHPDIVENYRAAHGISLASDHGQATTEDLRQAMVHYRSLFESLLGTGANTSSTNGSAMPGASSTGTSAQSTQSAPANANESSSAQAVPANADNPSTGAVSGGAVGEGQGSAYPPSSSSSGEQTPT
jgi:hypothetical protein